MPSPEMVPVFASTSLKLQPDEYAVVSLPVSEKERIYELFKSFSAFSSVTVVEDEVSLILKSSDWASIHDKFDVNESEEPYSVITFDIVLDLSLVGYLSVVSAILADEGISIYAVSTYLRDHILVKSGEAQRAVSVLTSLIERCKHTQ